MVERRKSPRVERRLSITLKGEAFRFVTETRNISATGAYCQVSRPIPAFSKVDVSLEVPFTDKKGAKLCKIQCKGVVVRSGSIARENGDFEKFFVAIYFTTLKARDRDKLDQYVVYHLTHPAHEP